MTDVFISYRTADEPVTAVFVKHVLGERFGADRVFLDNSSIPLGEHFPPVIEDALAHCRVLVAVIGPGWVALDEQGRRRLDNPADWVRREVSCALDRGIPVIPLLVGDARLVAEDLPAELTTLAARQSLAIRLRAVEHDLIPLIERLTPMIAPGSGDEGELSDSHAGSGVSTVFHGPVDARKAVFGISNTFYG